MSVCSRERIFFFWGVSCFCDSEKDLEQALFCVMAHDSAARSDPTCGKRFSSFEEGDKPPLRPPTGQFYESLCWAGGVLVGLGCSAEEGEWVS